MKNDDFDRMIADSLRRHDAAPDDDMARRITAAVVSHRQQPQQRKVRDYLIAVAAAMLSPWPSHMMPKAAALCFIALATFAVGAAQGVAPMDGDAAMAAVIFGDFIDTEVF